MKIGSKVTFVEGTTFPVEELKTYVINLNLPDPTKIYTIRSFGKNPTSGETIAYFKEIFIGTNENNGKEMGVETYALRVVDELFVDSIIEELESEMAKEEEFADVREYLFEQN